MCPNDKYIPNPMEINAMFKSRINLENDILANDGEYFCNNTFIIAALAALVIKYDVNVDYMLFLSCFYYVWLGYYVVGMGVF
jgi:hypothetical protein